MAIESVNRTALEALLDIIKMKDKFLTENAQFSYIYADVQIEFVNFLMKSKPNGQKAGDQDVSYPTYLINKQEN
jgi:hypothetical protein